MEHQHLSSFESLRLTPAVVVLACSAPRLVVPRFTTLPNAMKLAVALLALGSASAFVPQQTTSIRTHLEAASSSSNNWWTPAAVAVAGWGLASQLAVASVLPADETAVVVGGTFQSTYFPVSCGSDYEFSLTHSLTHSLTFCATAPTLPTTIILAGEVSTMDFSLPSYSDSVSGKDITVKPSAAPSFNPFGDFEPEVKKTDEEKAAAEAKKAEEKAAAEAKKAEEKAAADAKKAEDKAAAEAKKAEEKAAAEAKKAEKEARRQAELEKQKAAVESSVQAAPSIPEIKAPDISIPEFKAPDISIPEFKAPSLNIPKFDAPKFDMPKFDAPKFDTSGMDMPKVDMPKVDMPKFDGVDLPKVNLPKVSLPSFGGDSVDPAFLEPQEIRDDKAREARQVFLAADADAKDLEEQARVLREAANDKKKLARDARDLACQTRPGGKWICLRNPFQTGF